METKDEKSRDERGKEKEKDRRGDDKVRQFVRKLSKEEKDLVRLRDAVYRCSWEEMRQDLNDRLAKKPYIFKISSNIERDLPLIDRLESWEKKNGVNLTDYLAVEEPAS
ncbi:MAG: hypothetical protein HY719_17235 [Planctomycetes bacterium]|nr:hypothetical protein [Planctomycetota bacterium]